MTPKERISKIRSEIRINPKLCIERARLYTESYKSTESDPPVMRRAKAFEKVLREKVVVIHDGELIVGNPTSKRIAAPILPEIAWKWYTEVMFGPPGDPDEDNGFLTEAEKAEFRELLKYWDGRSLRDKWLSVLPDEYKDLEGLSWLQGAGNPNAGYYFAHCCPDFERILKKGIVGLIAEVDEKLNRTPITILDDFQKIIYQCYEDLLNAVICWGPAVRPCRRYGKGRKGSRKESRARENRVHMQQGSRESCGNLLRSASVGMDIVCGRHAGRLGTRTRLRTHGSISLSVLPKRHRQRGNYERKNQRTDLPVLP